MVVMNVARQQETLVLLTTTNAHTHTQSQCSYRRSQKGREDRERKWKVVAEQGRPQTVCLRRIVMWLFCVVVVVFVGCGDGGGGGGRE